MSREYFPLWLRLDGKDGFLLWYSDEPDGVFIASTRKIPVFRSLNALVVFARSHEISLERTGKLVPHDLDAAVRVCESSGFDPEGFGDLLVVWNLAGDVACSLELEFSGDSKLMNSVYEKLFHANMSDDVGGGAWSWDEARLLKSIVRDAVTLIRSRLEWR